MKDTTAIIAVIDALADSRVQHEPFKSPHEGVAVLLAAATQLNFSIASESNPKNQRALAVTIAETSLRFLMDVVPEGV